jgi:hypothetical protein
VISIFTDVLRKIRPDIAENLGNFANNEKGPANDPSEMPKTFRDSRLLLLAEFFGKLDRRAIEYAKFRSRSHDAVIRVYDEAGNVIQTHEHNGDFKE